MTTETPRTDAVLKAKQDGLSGQMHRLEHLARQLERELRKLAAEYADLKVYGRTPSANALTKAPPWGCGWLYGNNYKQRGRPAGFGKEQGEPWYVAEDGMLWSSFDVRWRPDEANATDSGSRP